LDMLDPDITTRRGDALLTTNGDDGSHTAEFKGNGNIYVNRHSFTIENTFSVVVRTTLATGTGGYLMAKTSASGKTRYFSM